MTFKPKILLVDEEYQIIKSLKKLFDSSIFDVNYATDIGEAHNRVNNEEYHIVIADQMTTDAAGIELLSHIKKKDPYTVRILMSNYGEIDMIVSAINDGSIYHCITKPWDNFNMVNLINNALAYCREQQIKRLVTNSLLRNNIDWHDLLNRMKMISNDASSEITDLLSKIISIKDEKLYKHSVQVAVYAQRLAADIKLSPSRIKDLKYASIFHDIGKITIRDRLKNMDILEKMELLDSRAHPEIGAEILSGIEGLDRASSIVLQHHERVDGFGYPYGLKAPDILLESKVFAICNIYEVLTSDSIYRLGLDNSEALKVIKDGIGSFYDKDVVYPFIRTINQN